VNATKEMPVEPVRQRIEFEPPEHTPGDFGSQAGWARERSDPVGIRLVDVLEAL